MIIKFKRNKLKKFIKNSLIVLSLAALTTGCTFKGSAGVSNVNISDVEINKIETMKTGTACIKAILGFPVSLDATALTAAKDAGINKIKYQEYSNTLIFPLYRSHCITVYGN